MIFHADVELDIQNCSMENIYPIHLNIVKITIVPIDIVYSGTVLELSSRCT